MALTDQDKDVLEKVLRTTSITNRARDIVRKLYLIAESDVYTVSLTKENKSLPASAAGVVSSYADSGTTISVYRGSTQLTGITSGTPKVGQFKVTATATDITAGAVSVTDTHNITFANSASIQEDEANISFSINAENVNTFVRVLHFVKAKIGATGAAGADSFPNDSIGLIFDPEANFTVAANSESWFKVGGGGGFNSHFNSKVATGYDGRCFASFVWAPGGNATRAQMKFGISSSAAAGNPGGESLISIFFSGGAWRGRIIQTGTAVGTFGTVAAGDKFSLRYDGTETTFFQDGVQITASTRPGRFIHTDDASVPSNLGGWILSGSMSTVGSADQVSSVRFLP